LNVSAQVDSFKVKLKQVLVPDQSSGIDYMSCNPRKRRSVYKNPLGNAWSIKVVSRPFSSLYKVSFYGRDSSARYKGKYFIVNGKLTSYKLQASGDSRSKLNNTILGLDAHSLLLNLQLFQSGYIGKLEWYNTTVGGDENYSLPVFIPAINEPNCFTPEGLKVIIPVILKVN
jgi:hypothetical protein